MRDLAVCLTAGLVWAASPVTAQVPTPPAPAFDMLRRGLDAEETAAMIGKLQAAQETLRRGEALYFELVSGAPASYPQTTMSPREAFLSADFSRPFDVERLPSENSSWKPHKLTLMPNGPGNLATDVKVVLGFYGEIARVEMFYRPPHPF